MTTTERLQDLIRRSAETDRSTATLRKRARKQARALTRALERYEEAEWAFLTGCYPTDA